MIWIIMVLNFSCDNVSAVNHVTTWEKVTSSGGKQLKSVQQLHTSLKGRELLALVMLLLYI